jgi:hypothetical protein
LDGGNLTCGISASSIPIIGHVWVNGSSSTIVVCFVDSVELLNIRLTWEQGRLLSSVLVGGAGGVDSTLHTFCRTSKLDGLALIILLRIGQVGLLILARASRRLVDAIWSNSWLLLQAWVVTFDSLINGVFFLGLNLFVLSFGESHH